MPGKYVHPRYILPALALFAVLAGGGWKAFFYRGAAGEMTQDAEAFVASLSAEEKSQATMPYNDKRRVEWHFIPKPERKGLQVKHMSAKQRELAKALLASALSEVGYTKATTIMSLEQILAELEKNKKGGNIRDAERYYFTIFGEPAAKGTWGLSVEGHHLSLNFVVTDGQIASHTPAFFGANPATVQKDYGVGPKMGTRILKDEEALAFDLLAALDPEQRKQAVIADKAPADIRAAGEAQTPRDAAAGIPAAKLSEGQRKTLLALIKTYCHNMPAEVAEAELAAIDKAGFDQIHFAWAGADQPGIGHYYRVEGPTFCLEFVNVQPDAAGNPANHIHSVWRNRGGDFAIAVNTPHD